MALKKLFIFLILSTAVPFSVSYAMEGDDHGVHTLGYRAGDPVQVRNSAEHDVSEKMSTYKRMAVYMGEIHGRVVTELETLDKLLTKKSKDPDVEASKKVLRTFLREQRNVPARDSEGLRSAVNLPEWARLHFLNSSIASRYIQPDPARLNATQPTWAVLENPDDLEGKAKIQYEEGLQSLEDFVEYAERLNSFVIVFHTSVTKAIEAGTGAESYKQLKPEYWPSFVKSIAIIQAKLDTIRQDYGIQVNEGSSSLVNVADFLYQRCVTDPKTHADERKAHIQQMRDGRIKRGLGRKESTAEQNQTFFNFWLRTHSRANPLPQN